MSAPGPSLPWPPVLIETLRSWSRRRRRLRAARRFGWAVTIAGLCAASAMTADLVGDPLPWLRVALAGGGLLCLVIGSVLALRSLVAPWRPGTAAREVERAAGLAGEPLSGPLDLAARPVPGHSAWMVDRALALAAVAADALDIRRLLPWRPAVPALIGAGAAITILLTASLVDPTARAAAARAVLPWRELPAPGDELLAVEPGDGWVAPGSTLAIAVRERNVPLTAELDWSEGATEVRPLLNDGGRQHLEVGPLHHAVRWRVRGPGLASAWRTTTVVDVPSLASLAMQLTPPGYSALPDERVQGGDATVIAGSSATIDVVLAGAAAATAAVVVDGREVPLALARSPYGGQFGSVRLLVTADVEWHLRVIVAGGPGGVVVDLPQRWRLHATADEAPTASAVADSTLIAPGRALRISVSAGDDVALAAVWLEVSSDGQREPVRLALPVPTGTRRMEAAAAIVPADLGAHPGDRLTAIPVARDRAGSEARGRPVVVAVAQPVHAARHVLVSRLDELVTQAEAAVGAAEESEKAWRAAARAWRGEDPAAGAAGLRAAAARARGLATAATAVADGTEATAALGGAPGNLEALATRSIAIAGSALALAARSAAAESGAVDAITGAAEAAAGLVRSATSLAASTRLAAATAATAAAAADLEAARDQLAGAAAVLAAERAWSTPQWQTALQATYWRGAEPGSGDVVLRADEVPAHTNRDVPGIGRDHWCARWEGQIMLPEAGRWTFRCTADDGVRLRLAGTDLLPADSWKNQAATAYLGSLELPAGWHPITVEYFQDGGGSSLLVEAGRGEPAPLQPDHLRHRPPLDPAARLAMAAMPAGAAESAISRAQHAAEAATGAIADLDTARDRIAGIGIDGAGEQCRQAVAALQPLAAVSDWSDDRVVANTAAAVAAAASHAADASSLLMRACQHDSRGAGGSGLTDRLRQAAAQPGTKRWHDLISELSGERASLAAVSADGSLEAAQRAANLAAAWALDAVITALAGSDADAARAAVAAATPAMALTARHARAVEAASSAARQSSPLLAELAVSPGWPPGLLRPARDLLHQAVAAMRAGSDPEAAVPLTSEVARAIDLEAMRPGAPPSEALATAAAWLRDLSVLPQADALAEIAELLEHVDRSGSMTRPLSRALAAAAEARRTAAAGTLRDSAAALAAAAPALAAAGLTDLSTRAASLADVARTVAASPDPAVARGLAEALSGSVAAPIIDALANGRLDPGSLAAQAGRLAAQTAAAASAMAAVSISAPPAGGAADDEHAGVSRANDRVASDAASAAAAVEFPEEHRAAIRAYLRRIGAPR